MNTVGLSAIRIQAASSLTGKAPAFATMTEHQARWAPALYYRAIVPSDTVGNPMQNFRILPNPQTGMIHVGFDKLSSFVELNTGLQIPLAKLTLEPHNDGITDFVDQYSK